ncbi:hypothetical protein HanIR_Chr04g0195251 [Helianthus annuus]|nr:hypothetical protein HanIR_Chr04g0195251 [Helianthus annuus]
MRIVVDKTWNLFYQIFLKSSILINIFIINTLLGKNFQYNSTLSCEDTPTGD